MDIEKILTEGIVFKGSKSSDGKKKEEKVKPVLITTVHSQLFSPLP